MKMESLAARRDEIEVRENQLKESLLKFDTFIKVSTKQAHTGPRRLKKLT